MTQKMINDEWAAAEARKIQRAIRASIEGRNLELVERTCRDWLGSDKTRDPFAFSRDQGPTLSQSYAAVSAPEVPLALRLVAAELGARSLDPQSRAALQDEKTVDRINERFMHLTPARMAHILKLNPL